MCRCAVSHHIQTCQNQHDCVTGCSATSLLGKRARSGPYRVMNMESLLFEAFCSSQGVFLSLLFLQDFAPGTAPSKSPRRFYFDAVPATWKELEL